MNKCPPHDPVGLTTTDGGNPWICVQCKKVLSSYRNYTQEEVEVLVAAVLAIRKQSEEKKGEK